MNLLSGLRNPEGWKNVAGYAAAAVLSAAAAAFALKLWHADPCVPLWYGGDSLMGQMLVQDVLESGLDQRQRPPRRARRDGHG